MQESTSPEVHELDPDAFRRRVRSFEHWFEAVEGYLTGLDHGHADLPEEPLDEDRRQRLISVLSTYCVGESAALEASSGLIRLAPNTETRIFLATQVVDEARHLEVLLARIEELGAPDPEAVVAERAAPSIEAFKRRLLEFVDARQWLCALFAQNVMLESMEYVTFGAHARSADPVTRDLLERVLRDERRHLGFGENEIARDLKRTPAARRELAAVKDELDALVLETFEHAAGEIGLSVSEGPELGRAYLQAVSRLRID